MKPTPYLDENDNIIDESDENNADIPTYCLDNNVDLLNCRIYKTYNTVLNEQRYHRSTKLIYGYATLWFMLMGFMIFILWNKRTKLVHGYYIHAFFFIAPMIGVIAYIIRQLYFILR